MTLTTVKSSMLYAVGYDAESRELEAIFNTGHIYRYKNVPAEIYDRLLAAESKGAFMRSQVIGVFPCARLSTRRAPKRNATRSAGPYRPAGSYRRTTRDARRQRGSR